MIPILRRLLALVDSRRLRERQILAVVAVVAGVAIGWFGSLDALIAKQEQVRADMRTRDAELARLSTQSEETKKNMRDPDVANRERLEQLKRLLAEADAGVASKAERIVPPGRVAALLEELIRRNARLELRELRSLPPRPLLDGVKKNEARDAGNGGASKKAEASRVRNDGDDIVQRAARGIWRHGIKLRIAGAYLDLADYLVQLEQLPMQVFWSDVTVDADKHPAVEMTVTLFTINFDDYWLGLEARDEVRQRAAAALLAEAAGQVRRVVRSGLVDPTQPWQPGAALAASGGASDPGARTLYAIWRVGDRRYALIDDEVVTAGAMLAGDRVLAIDDSRVTLRGAGGNATLDLATGIDKQPAGIASTSATPARVSRDVRKTGRASAVVPERTMERTLDRTTEQRTSQDMPR